MKKRAGTGMAVLHVVIAVAIILILISFIRMIRVYRLSKKLDVRVDGTVSEVSSEWSEKTDEYEDTSPADVLVSKTDDQRREVSIVFIGVNENESINQRVLKLVRKNRIPASFAIPAIHARENDGFLLRSGRQVFESSAMDWMEKLVLRRFQRMNCAISFLYQKRFLTQRAGKISQGSAALGR